MRRTATVILLAAGLTLAGCSSSDRTVSTKPSPVKTVSPKVRFLAAARTIEFNGTPSDSALTAFPPKWCSALDAGHSVEWMFNNTAGEDLYPVGDDWGTVKQDADTLLVAGVKAYCPRNLADVKEQLRADGGY